MKEESNKNISIISLFNYNEQDKNEEYNIEEYSIKSLYRVDENTIIFKIFLYSNIFRSFIGLGILVFPHAIQLTGQIAAFICTIISFFIFFYGTNILFKVCDKINFNDRRYESLIYKVLGSKYKLISEIFLIYTQLSCSIATLILTVNFLNYISCLFEYSLICNKKNYLILYGFLISFPMMFIRNLKGFSIISTITTLIISISIFSILVWNFYKIYLNPNLLKTNWIKFDLSKLPTFFGVALYSIEGIGLTIPLRSTVKNKKNFTKAYNNVQIITLFIIILFGFSSVYIFGIRTLNFLFFNFSKEQIYFFSLGVLYSIVN